MFTRLFETLFCFMLFLFFIEGCWPNQKITTTSKIEPIHITVDVNVRVKVDKALNNYFDDLDKEEQKMLPLVKEKRLK